jgi:transposase InsO family protein
VPQGLLDLGSQAVLGAGGEVVALRQEHPERGVRRIRDDLRRNEGLEVSAEKVRTVVSEAGLGNPPPQPRRRPPGIRRFERSCPNALWQIDIFTFQLKRMYPVYLIGVIDDHSRYLVGWGLFRQQNAEAVFEDTVSFQSAMFLPSRQPTDCRHASGVFHNTSNGRPATAWR